MNGSGYTLRPALLKDALVLAHFRAGMFLDMQAPLEEGWEACWTAYFQQALVDGRYWAMLATVGGRPVACAGLMVLPMVPLPSDPSGGRAHVQGVYTLPEYRGRGLAETLTRAVLKEAQGRGYKAANLTASAPGRGIYERLGFVEATSPELRLNLGQIRERVKG